jgi:putative membrane protein
MSPAVKSFLQRWIITTLGVLVAANVVKGISYDTAGSLLVASLLLGVFNGVLRPIIMILSFPLMILTLGLFTLVINAFLLYLVGILVKPFHVAGFWPAFKGALLISIVSMFANAAIGKKEPPRQVKTAKPPEERGPVIDV